MIFGEFIISGSELLLSGKTLATGSAKRDLYAKPTASRLVAQLWVGKGARAVPRGGLMLLDVSRMCKSCFAEHYPLIHLYPQLRRKAACSGFRIEVYLRHTPCALNPNRH